MADETKRRRRSDRRPDRWSDPRKAASPSETPALPFRETAALAGLMYMQRDAVAFYAVAHGRTGSAAADNVVAGLKDLHESAVRDLWERLRHMPRPEFSEEADSDVREYFSPLARKLPHGLTRALADDITLAEENCLHATEETMDSGVDEETRAFLADHLARLGEAQERAAEIREIAKDAETPSA